MKKRVIIIGGGAAGSIAALAAAGSGAEVQILEQNEMIGRKILSTGNGRCNFTNRFQAPSCYRSENAGFPWEVIGKFPEPETTAFFEKLGIYPKDKNGYLYPWSEQASSVREALEAALELAKIRIHTGVHVFGIVPKKNGFQVSFSKDGKKGMISGDAVILATGSKAAAKLGSDGSGYDLAKMLGHKLVPVVPALVQLRCREKLYRQVAGVRTHGKVTVFIDGKETASDTGELQLTDYGISGIPVFQLSAAVSEALQTNKKISASIDFFPAVPLSKWNEFCCRQYQACCGKHVRFLAQGILPSKLAQLFIERSPLKAQDIVTAANKNAVFSMLQNMRALKTVVIGTNPAQNAQVCTGGISLQEVTDDLEAKRFPGLYLCGELLDVDGRCGGYNLQWAWTSGQIAGTAAAHEE